ncbi:response regulator transcription factor [Cryptosporangium sp. NPDC051539]|uniref:response regulator transcription factor n=1 Tax=Cryptosporangium sp. NPDC051539 TaxID=3363962 RepID=UPI0037953971
MVESGLVLVAEDEPSIADLITLYLERDGYRVRVETDGATALQEIRRLRPVAAILDIALPSRTGTDICRALRAENDWTPVLFVTARDDEIDRILGLELGADDYLTKPFSPRELVARLRSVLRRSRTATGANPRSAGPLFTSTLPTGSLSTGPLSTGTLTIGTLRVDPGARRTWVGDTEVPLTATEFDLLAHLMRSPGRVHTREQLLSAVWGYAAVSGARTVDVHVAQVRGKLGPASPIRTVRGVGYSAEPS